MDIDLEDTLDELDAMAEVSTNKFEADLFMTSSRAAMVTKRVAAKLRARFAAGKTSRWRFVRDGLYREQILDRLVAAEVRRLYKNFHARSPDIKNPKPSRKLVAELARAYRKKARGFISILRVLKAGFGLVFEDEEDWEYEHAY